MTKKVLALLLSVLMLIGMFPMSAAAATDATTRVKGLKPDGGLDAVSVSATVEDTAHTVTLSGHVKTTRKEGNSDAACWAGVGILPPAGYEKNTKVYYELSNKGASASFVLNNTDGTLDDIQGNDKGFYIWIDVDNQQSGDVDLSLKWEADGQQDPAIETFNFVWTNALTYCLCTIECKCEDSTCECTECDCDGCKGKKEEDGISYVQITGDPYRLKNAQGTVGASAATNSFADDVNTIAITAAAKPTKNPDGTTANWFGIGIEPPTGKTKVMVYPGNAKTVQGEVTYNPYTPDDKTKNLDWLQTGEKYGYTFWAGATAAETGEAYRTLKWMSGDNDDAPVYQIIHFTWTATAQKTALTLKEVGFAADQTTATTEANKALNAVNDKRPALTDVAPNTMWATFTLDGTPEGNIEISFTNGGKTYTETFETVSNNSTGGIAYFSFEPGHKGAATFTPGNVGGEYTISATIANGTVVDNNKTLKIYEIVKNYNDGTNKVESVLSTEVPTAKPSDTPTRDGYTFAGWTGPETFNATTYVYTYQAEWTNNDPETVAVTLGEVGFESVAATAVEKINTAVAKVNQNVTIPAADVDNDTMWATFSLSPEAKVTTNTAIHVTFAKDGEATKTYTENINPSQAGSTGGVAYVSFNKHIAALKPIEGKYNITASVDNGQPTEAKVVEIYKVTVNYNDGGATETTTTYQTTAPTKPATPSYAGHTFTDWTVTGEGTYDVTYTAEWTEDEAPDHEHIWGPVEWAADWTGSDEDGWTITATQSCTVQDEEHTETLTVNVEEVKVFPDCTTPGSITYSATATKKDGTTEKYTSDKVVPLPATGHIWGEEIEWNWTDYTAATATRTCTVVASHTETENATITSVPTAPTCTEAGYTTYTASVTFAGEDEAVTDEKVEAGAAATGHDFEVKDGKLVCKNECGTELDIEPAEEGSDTQTAVLVDPGIQDITEDLAATQFNTVEAIEAELQRTVDAQIGYTSENIAIYDVQLLVNDTTDPTTTWEPADADTVGEYVDSHNYVTAFLPYPETEEDFATNYAKYDFVVLHMISHGEKAGDVEIVKNVSKSATGLTIKLESLSPIAVSWKEKQSSGSTGGTVVVPDEGDETDACPKDSTCPIAQFKDASPNAWYHDAVHYCLENGLMNGNGDGTFSPNGTVTRATVVQLLYNMSGKPASVDTGAFSDVETGVWYTNAVHWAAANDIVAGFGDGTFRPTAPVTREQMVVIFRNYAERYAGLNVNVIADLSGYTDAGNVSGWAVSAMQWAVGVGLISGTSSTTLSPASTSERAQAAVVLMKYCENIA